MRNEALLFVLELEDVLVPILSESSLTSLEKEFYFHEVSKRPDVVPVSIGGIDTFIATSTKDLLRDLHFLDQNDPTVHVRWVSSWGSATGVLEEETNGVIPSFKHVPVKTSEDQSFLNAKVEATENFVKELSMGHPCLMLTTLDINDDFKNLLQSRGGNYYYGFSSIRPSQNEYYLEEVNTFSLQKFVRKEVARILEQRNLAENLEIFKKLRTVG